MHIQQIPIKAFFLIISIIASFTFIPVFVICIIFPCWIIRQLAIATARCKPSLYKELSVDSSFTAIDNLYTKPRNNLVPISYVKGPLPYDQFRDRVAALLESDKFPELKCCLHRWFATFFWKRVDPSEFRLDNHISKSDVSDPSEFRAVVESLVSKPFTRGQPLWEIVAFPNYSDKGIGSSSAFAVRLHHSLCDGYGFTTLLKSIEDPNNDIEEALAKIKAKFKNQLKESMGLIYYLKLLFITPTCVIFTILNNFNSNGWTLPDYKRTGGELVFYENTGELDLTFVKNIAKRRGLGFTTIVLEGITSAIRTTMMEQGHKINSDLTIVYPWPKPGHPGTLTNHAFALPIVAPISMSDREARLAFISHEFKKWHRSPTTVGLMAAASGFGVLQGVTNLWASRGHYGTMLLSNFHFYPKIGTMFGSEMTQFDCIAGLQIPHISIVMGTGGYNGKLNLSVKSDRSVLDSKKSAQRFIDLIVQEFEHLDRDGVNNNIEIVSVV